MAQGVINDTTLTSIADAIREKLESTDTMFPSEMAALIESIEAGGSGKIAYGSVSFSSGTTKSVTHGLGVKPTFYMCTSETNRSKPMVFYGDFNGTEAGFRWDGGTTTIYDLTLSYVAPTETNLRVYGEAGYTSVWIAGVLENG